MVISLKKQLTIEQISALKDELAQGLGMSNKLTIDLHQAEQVDTAFLQLLCALRDAATRDNKVVILSLPADPDSCFRRACREAGLEHLCPE